jgi:hypothetical protein
MTDTHSPITLAIAAAGLRALANFDIRTTPPSGYYYEPFRCHRCHDRGWVTDWAGHRVTWLWQRFEPYRRIPCPDCGSEATA